MDVGLRDRSALCFKHALNLIQHDPTIGEVVQAVTAHDAAVTGLSMCVCCLLSMRMTMDCQVIVT